MRRVTARSLAATGMVVCALSLVVPSACQAALSEGPDEAGDDHGNSRDAATEIASGSPVSGALGAQGDIDYFKVKVDATMVRMVAAVEAAGVRAASAPAVAIGFPDGGGSTTEGAVAWASLPSPRPAYAYVRVSGRAAGYRLAVWSVAPRTDAFEIELRYRGTQPDAEQRAAIDRAARFWEQVIAAGLPDIPVVTSAWKCDRDDPSPFGQYVDDLVIDVRIATIDGREGVPAQSTICARRTVDDGGLPFIGSITFDSADLAALEEHRYLERAAMRQVAQVLGFGLLWDERQFDLLRRPSVAPGGAEVPGRDTRFIGSQAVTAFSELGGAAYPGTGVPVENDTDQYGAGTPALARVGVRRRVDDDRAGDRRLIASLADLGYTTTGRSRWRESSARGVHAGGVFGRARRGLSCARYLRLMTTVLETAVPPVSSVTIASLADLGYQVHYHRAEPYALPGGNAGAAGVLQFRGRAVRAPAVAVAELPAGLVQAVNGR